MAFPTLNQNIAYNALYNAYSLITTVGDTLTGLETTLADRYKISAGEYEDQLVYTFVDVLASRVWDPTDANVLTPEQKATISQQAILVDKKRQIGLYIPANFLTKQAWAKAGNFDTFAAVVDAQVGNTRKIYDQRKMNVYVGTTKTTTGQQAQTVTLSGTNDSLAIANKIADIEVELKDSTRDYNDKGYMEATAKGEYDIIWNSKFVNKITKLDLPVIFHKDGLFEFSDILPARYFGAAATASDVGSGKIIKADGTYDNTKGNLRFAEETAITSGGVTTDYFAGDLVPNATSVYDTVGTAFKFPVYIEDAKVICKIIHKDAIKYASVIETNTEFFNAKNHSTNKYLTWMYGEPDRLLIRPFVTLAQA